MGCAAVWKLLPVLLFGLSGGCGAPPSDAELLARAQDLLNQDDRQGAIVELRRALLLNESNVEARILLGTTLLAVGNPGGARKELRTALQLGAERNRIVFPLAQAYFRQGAYEELLNLIHLQDAVGDDAGQLLVLRSRALLARDRPGEALESFLAALDRHPGLPDALFGLADWALREERMEDAETYLQAARTMVPNNPRLLLIEGKIAHLKGRFAQAMALYQEAADRLADPTPARLELAWTSFALGRYEQASDYAAQVLGHNPDQFLAHYVMAVIAFRDADYQRAANSARHSLDTAPDQPRTLLLLGAAYLALGNDLDALTRLTRYAALRPGDLRGHRLTARARIGAGEIEKALTDLHGALAAFPDDPDLLLSGALAALRADDVLQAQERLLRATPGLDAVRRSHAEEAYDDLAAGEIEAAVRSLESARPDLDLGFPGAGTLRPAEQAAQHEQAQRDLQAGEYAAVMDRVIDRLLPLTPDDPAVYNLLGAAQFGQGKRDAARRSFARALEMAPHDVAARVNLASLAMAQGRVVEARERYRAVLEQRPDFLPALSGLARVASEQGDTAQAIRLLEQARAAHPGAIAPRLTLSHLYLELSRPRAALESVAEAYRFQPSNAAVLEALGRAQRAAGDQQAALETYHALARSLPESPAAHYRLGLAQIRSGNSGAAEQSLSRALQLDPAHVPSAVALARLQLREGAPESALETARALYDNAPENAEGPWLEGEALLALGRSEGAIAALRQALTLEPAPVMRRTILIALGQADAEAATHLMETWLAQHPGDDVTRLFLAQAYLDRGSLERARDHYSMVVQRAPKHPLALNNLASVYNALEQWEDAVPYAERALQQMPASGSVKDTLGWALVHTADRSRGRALLRKALEERPADPGLRYRLAFALAEAGDRDGARDHLRRALGSGSEFAERKTARRLLAQLDGAESGTSRR